jgi:RimJ/RimL family protein N-acetyltransferase
VPPSGIAPLACRRGPSSPRRRRLGLERVEILTAVENEASRRVAERAGATLEGTVRHRFLLHGVYHDAHLYSLVRTDIA